MMISGSACKLTNTNNWYRALPWSATSEPLLVFISNIFAILGLRAMYFMLAGDRARIDRACPSAAPSASP
jgi:hypothetical protein